MTGFDTLMAVANGLQRYQKLISCLNCYDFEKNKLKLTLTFFSKVFCYLRSLDNIFKSYFGQFCCEHDYDETNKDCIQQFPPLLAVSLQPILYAKTNSSGDYIILYL